MKRLKSLTYPRLLNILAAVFVPVLSYYLLEFMTHNPFEIPVQFQLLGWLFAYLFSGLIFFLGGRMNLALVLPLLFTAVVGTVNYFVLQFRQSPILPWDIASMGTALSVADHFSFTPSARLIGILAAYLLLAVFCLKVNLVLNRPRKIRAAGFGLTAVISVLYVLCLQNDALMKALNVYEMPFTQDYAYEQNGFFVSFLVNTKYLKVEKPEGYSPEKADELLREAEGSSAPSILVSANTLGKNMLSDAGGEKPNIIVIMNEAYSDLSVIGDLEASEDYMPYFRSLYGAENTISGNVHVSVLGGNTANTEFEFLTGDSMAFLPTGSIPYQQFLSEELPALPKILKDCGYTTTALHPYNSNGWRREEVYPLLGFDEFLYNGTFTYKDRLRGYITDESAFKEIIRAYEEKKDDGPFFSFLVTMQNHGGYAKEWDDFERTITVKGQENDRLSRINAYLTLLKITDDAYRDLISYYENVDEKTIILMFGDHQPHMDDSFLEALYGKDLNTLTQEEMALRYQTPFVLWANYDINEAEHVDISANYLSTLLMETAGLEKTPYQSFLSGLQKELPVVTANFCIDADGNFYGSEGRGRLEELLGNYEIIQYNHLFDEAHRKDENFLNAP